MTRLRADFCLLITAFIWGLAFAAQKTGMDGLGPLGFIAARFTLSFFVVLPLALRESRRRKALTKADWRDGALLCFLFFMGCFLQQAAIVTSDITNAGFLTSLYVVGTPFAAWAMTRRAPARTVWPACALAITGIWFLNGGALAAFHGGEWMLIACAGFYSVQIALLGMLAQRTGRPLTLSVMQYGATAALAMGGAALSGEFTWGGLAANVWPIAYAGIISGGIAYTLQSVAQQYTPQADAAIILSGEALFAGLAGAWLFGERLTPMGWAGCGLIMAAILLVEAGPLLKKKAG